MDCWHNVEQTIQQYDDGFSYSKVVETPDRSGVSMGSIESNLIRMTADFMLFSRARCLSHRSMQSAVPTFRGQSPSSEWSFFPSIILIHGSCFDTV